MNFHASGLVSHEVDHIALFLLGATVLLMGFLLALLAYFCCRYRAGRAADRSHRPASSWKVEASASAVVLALGLTAFAWAGRVYLRQYAAPPGALDIYVLGKRWMWTFQLPGGPANIGLLEVPLHRPVRLLLTSEDVIHSFYAPELRIKQDALPGRYTSLTFTADELGDFTILCSEFCGTDHSGMRAVLRVVSEEEFDCHRRNPAALPLYDGKKIYRRLGCASCHETAGHLAPALAGLYGRLVPLASGGSIVSDEDYLRASILYPARDVVAGYQPLMPTYRGQLSEPELAALVEYLKRLPARGASP